jgi:AraC family carnitine catabolism transcriptional activator
LQRLFEGELQATPRNYYLALRLERARRLLEETDLDVLAVAMACGFVSSSSLARAFRGHYGMSPRQVRQPSAG